MKYVRKKDCIYRDPKTGRTMKHEGYAVSIHWSKQMLDDMRRLFPTTLNQELAEYLGVSPRTLTRKARQMGLEKDPAWLQGIYNQRREWAHMAARSKGYPGIFQKGKRHNPAGEFKKGHTFTPEQNLRRGASIRKWCRENPRKVHERAIKAWVTRKRNQGEHPQDS